MAKKKLVKKELPIIYKIVKDDAKEVINPPVKTRLQELQELYEVLKKENITSISKLEAMISQLQS